jgi:hypothetical protein
MEWNDNDRGNSMKIIKTFIIQTRRIIEFKRTGERLHNVEFSKYKTWNKKTTAIDNFKDAVRKTNRAMRKYHEGYIVYRRLKLNGKSTNDVEQLYQAKWGHNDKPYVAFKPLGRAWLKGKIS